ncbi:MAG TPA: hypothetical protein VFD52_07500 [Clostridia bacterium]|nr:hypothetical protein [Clostridia bacterium]
MKAIKTIFQMYGSFLKITKTIIKLGLILILLLYTSAVVTYILAGIKFDYYPAMSIAQQLSSSACRSVGVLGLGVILFESVINI